MNTTPRGDDGRLSRFDRRGARRLRARDAVRTILIAALLLVALEGASIRHAGEQMGSGVQRDLVLAVGRPAGWIADQLPFSRLSRHATAWLAPQGSLGDARGFTQPVAASGSSEPPPVTPDAFDPAALGVAPPPRRPLQRLLVTGDSMSMPLDLHLARALAGAGVKVTREAHVGTGISKSILVDWGKLSESQVAAEHPQAVVVFIGANEGFPMPGPGGRDVQCCGPDWASIYASRARRMMNTYRQGGAARVYWLTLPTPREPARQTIARAVNAAVTVAAQPWQDQVRVLDTVPIFTPGGRYRDAMTVRGTQAIVRESDGIHLNDTGSGLASDLVLEAVRRDFLLK